MSECTERSEGRERMPSRHRMSECTERSEGRERMHQGRHHMTRMFSQPAGGGRRV